MHSHKLLATSGISDFTLKDITAPEAKRLRRNLSAVINFAKFREDRQPGYVEFTQETDSLAQQKAKLEEDNEKLLMAYTDAKRQREQEEPELKRLTADNERRGEIVRGLFNRQTEVHNACQSLKAQLHGVSDQSKPHHRRQPRRSPRRLQLQSPRR